jgi:hypothetical protein
MAAIRERNLVVVGESPADHWGQIMKRSTKHKTKEWFERAKLVVAAARDRAIETTQQRVVPSMKSFPTVVHRRRLAERLGARS